MEKYSLSPNMMALTFCVNGALSKTKSTVKQTFFYKHDKEIIQHQLKRQNVTGLTATCVLEKGSS